MALTVNKEALVAQIADKAGLTKVQATQALNAFTDTVIEAVADGSKVTLIGFGTFESREQAARTGRNPQTGETIEIPAKVAPKFSAGKAFKQACNQ